jgi:hypothetical protein
MFKKAMLMGAALAAITAWVAPSVQAAPLQFNEGQESYEGKLSFHAPPPFKGTFGCDVTVTVEAEGGTTATVTQFTPTTSTCAGTELFAGCKLKAHESSAPFAVHTTTTDLVITDSPGNIVIKNTYEGCSSGLPGSTLEFTSVTGTQTNTVGGNRGKIHTIEIHGTSTSGSVVTGTVTAEADEAVEVN